MTNEKKSLWNRLFSREKKAKPLPLQLQEPDTVPMTENPLYETKESSPFKFDDSKTFNTSNLQMKRYDSKDSLVSLEEESGTEFMQRNPLYVSYSQSSGRSSPDSGYDRATSLKFCLTNYIVHS